MRWASRPWTTHGPAQGVNRRQVLGRAAVVGGALVWTTPVVQVVSLTAAHAEPQRSASAGGQHAYGLTRRG
jgi:hypothetical protein